MFRKLNFLFSFVLINGLGWTFSIQRKGSRDYIFTIKNDLFFFLTSINSTCCLENSSPYICGIYNLEF